MTEGATGREGRRPTVAVVGGGIAGLAAAWELTGGAEGPGPDGPDVVLLEAGRHLGGKLRSEELGGRPVDLGPDGFLARRPEATQLCRELGLGDELEPIGASGASLWARGRPRLLPEGLNLGVPTRFWPVARSGILSWHGTLRLLLDVVSPRPNDRGPLGDRAVGPLVARKLGQEVVDTLVDPLIGGIHAGTVADMSAASLFPLLLAVAQRRGSFMRALRQASQPGAQGQPGPPDGRPAGPPGGTATGEPAFWSLQGGMGSLVACLAGRLGDRGVTVRTGAPVELLDRGAPPASPWVLHTPDGPVLADGVVLAVPAPVTAALLAPHDAEASGLLRSIEHASVAVVTFSYPREAAARPLPGTGLLVPAGTRNPDASDDDGTFLVTACTYLSAKWPHLARDGDILVRASAGRFGDTRPDELSDEALAHRAARELGTLIGVEGQPSVWRVTRWPEAFPQYRVHHLIRVAGVEAAVKRLPALAVAGAAYRGVGIPACVGSGRTAARSVLEAVSGSSDRVGGPG